MDWDITPTETKEYITIIGTDASKLIYSSDNGFCYDNPLIACDPLYRAIGTLNVDFEDIGPADNGAVFDLDLGPLSPGQSVKFDMFYGVAPGEINALAALAKVGAEIASLA